MKKYKTKRSPDKGVELSVGVKRGRLTILEELVPKYDYKGQKIRQFRCVCDCGTEVIKNSETLRYGLIPSCGCAHKAIINEGDKFGTLTVIRQLTTGLRTYLCKCECGHECVKSVKSLIGGTAKCDGPNHKIKRLYRVFRNMVNRCYQPNNEMYHHYGGRGIKVCDEWLNDYYSFQRWAMANGYDPEAIKGEKTIDRIDNNGDYTPDNCRWIDMQKQSRNKRTNHLLTYNGETHPLKEWAEIAGVPFENVYSRINKFGWSVGEALELEPHTPRPKTPKSPRKKGYANPSKMKPVEQMDLQGNIINTFNAMKDASHIALPASIGKCCHGTQHTAGGFRWRFKGN